MRDNFKQVNLLYLLKQKNSILNFDKLLPIYQNVNNQGTFIVPEQFSIIENPSNSYKFIQQLTSVLIHQKYQFIYIDYKNCEFIGLETQIFLDIILKDIIEWFKEDDSNKIKQIKAINVKNENVKKMLYSVGSPVILTGKKIKYDDIVPYQLCTYFTDKDSNQHKAIDTTNLVNYVVKSLKKINKFLSQEKIDSIGTVVGEILINAEEHSSTNCRFSIGYFQKLQENTGVFKLVILNFGETIYEKFKNPSCENKDIVANMNILSKKYTENGFFFLNEFEEETLWTLYALQEGVTSVPTTTYYKRGNGSIQFIENFFNLKCEKEDISKMVILSGKTNITFDGTYKIVEKEKDSEKFKYMTFNNSGEISEKPDNKYVKYVDYYFPGTVISVDLLL